MQSPRKSLWLRILFARRRPELRKLLAQMANLQRRAKLAFFMKRPSQARDTMQPGRPAIPDLSDFIFEPDLSRASTLPARWYTDSSILAMERERIFARTWQAAGHADWVAQPGSWFGCDIAGEPVLVTRAADGKLRAMSNVC